MATLPTLGYDSFDQNLNAYITFKYTDAASQAVAQQEIASKVLQKMHAEFYGQVPFPQFQQELQETEPTWGGPLLYFSLSKFSNDDTDNLPVPTDALEAIFRCAGLDIYGCQPNDVDRVYTDLLSHQNGGTPGSQLTDEDVATYGNIITYIVSYQGKTFDDVKAYMESTFNTVSDYAKQDLLAMIDPELNPRPYYYAEDTEYFQNREKLLPIESDDQYYREHVIPSIGVGKYNAADNVGRYRYVTGKGGEYYITVHYNQFLRVDALIQAASSPGNITQQEVISWMNLYIDKTSPSYDPNFYSEIEDLAQIAGVVAADLLNIASLDPTQLTLVLSQLNDVFLTILANPPPSIGK